MPAMRTSGIPKPRPTPRPAFRAVESEFELLLSGADEELLEGVVEVVLVEELVEDEAKSTRLKWLRRSRR